MKVQKHTYVLYININRAEIISEKKREILKVIHRLKVYNYSMDFRDFHDFNVYLSFMIGAKQLCIQRTCNVQKCYGITPQT